MSLDERLFELATRAARRWRQRPDPARAAVRVRLADLENRLQALAVVLGGDGLEVRASEGAGGVRGSSLLLPAAVDLAPTRVANTAVYVWRVAFAVVSRQLGYGLPPGCGDPLRRELATLLAVRRTRRVLVRAWPGAGALWQQLAPAVAVETEAAAASPLLDLHAGVCGAEPQHDWVTEVLRSEPRPAELGAAVERVWQCTPRRQRRQPCWPGGFALWGRLLAPAASRDTAEAAPERPAPQHALPCGTERTGRPRDDLERPQPASDPRGDNPLMHVFEKLFTAEEFQGGDRRMDGEDELEQHLEALDQLELRQLTRAAVPTASIYRADLELQSAAPEVAAAAAAAEETVRYDEWDQHHRRYRPGWCVLHAHVPEPPAGAEHTRRHCRAVRQRYARQIRALRADLARLDRRRLPRCRQRTGQEVDIDALVDRHGALAAVRGGRGRVDDQRLYVARRPRRPELATLILLDGSLSTDAWIGGQRVLDIARDAILVLADVLDRPDLEVAVGAFYSNSRRDCHYLRVKDFDTGWETARRRLLGLRPTGYTRIGAALRHAGGVLRRRSAHRRLLLLLSDGKPTDYDRYEGRHGTADVRQALREAHAAGIATFALAVSESALHYLPPMFGRGGFEILPDPARLPASLVRLYQRVLR